MRLQCQRFLRVRWSGGTSPLPLITVDSHVEAPENGALHPTSTTGGTVWQLLRNSSVERDGAKQSSGGLSRAENVRLLVPEASHPTLTTH